MKRWGIAALAAALALTGTGSAVAAIEPDPGGLGDGYRCETVVREPNAPRYGDLGSQRALRKENELSDGFLDGVKDFSCKTASIVLNNSEENVNYSPVSLYYALALTAQGAGGSTKEQLCSLLSPSGQGMEQLSQDCGRLYRLMYRNNEYSRIRLGNSMWLQEGKSLNETYRKAAEQQYYASVFRVDFKNAATEDRIAGWIAGQTGQNPVPVRQAEETGSDEVLRLVNAVYFYDQWLYGFDRGKNRTGTFYKADGQEIACEYMSDTHSSSYYRGDGFVRASLALKDNAWMAFILPEEGVAVESLLASQETMLDMFGTVGSVFESYGPVSWTVPKFSYQTSMDLRPVLESLGAAGLFDPGRSDLSGITGEALYVTDVVQNTRIGIDENGVEASAYTEIMLGAGSAMGGEPLAMNLNRPFLYAVVTVPGVPLFVGICNQPGV